MAPPVRTGRAEAWSGVLLVSARMGRKIYMRYRITLLKVAIVLLPSYAAAYFTGEMVWVVPTLVGSGLLAAGVGSSGTTTRLDEDGDDGDDGDESDDEFTDDS